MTPPRYRHIIWDWNGTLLDDLDYSIAVMNRLLLPRGLPALDRARYHALFDFPVQSYYARLGFDPVADPFEKVSHEFIRGYDAQRLTCSLHPATRHVVGALQRAGLGQSILSAYRQSTLSEIVAHFDLTPHFAHVVGLDNVHAHSKLALGRDLLTRLPDTPCDILLVGDTLHDLEVAEALGTDCLLVASGHHSAERLRSRAPQVVADLAELAARLGLN